MGNNPGSRIQIFIYPASPIPDLGSNKNKKEEGEKKVVFIPVPVFTAINSTKFKIILLLKNLSQQKNN